MKVHQITLTVIDFDEMGADAIKATIENTRYPNHCISPSVRHIETRDIGPWDDDHPLNKHSTREKELKRLFD